MCHFQFCCFLADVAKNVHSLRLRFSLDINLTKTLKNSFAEVCRVVELLERLVYTHPVQMVSLNNFIVVECYISCRIIFTKYLQYNILCEVYNTRTVGIF